MCVCVCVCQCVCVCVLSERVIVCERMYIMYNMYVGEFMSVSLVYTYRMLCMRVCVCVCVVVSKCQGICRLMKQTDLTTPQRHRQEELVLSV